MSKEVLTGLSGRNASFFFLLRMEGKVSTALKRMKLKKCWSKRMLLAGALTASENKKQQIAQFGFGSIRLCDIRASERVRERSYDRPGQTRE
jgi:hypothetical protein